MQELDEYLLLKIKEKVPPKLIENVPEDWLLPVFKKWILNTLRNEINDVQIKSKKGNKEKYGKITKSLTKDKLKDLYIYKQKSLQDIAKEYNCTRQMIKLLMEKYGLKRRRRSKARVLAIKRGKFKDFGYHDIDENFFSKWTPQMAWVLGLLFTDGCIWFPKKGTMGCRVSISSKDYEMLENIKHHLKSTNPIDIRVQSKDETKYIYRLTFYREKILEDLQKLGLIQRKSLILEFPNIPNEYIRHFIRGCWDGDGSVYITQGSPNASFVSGSKTFIKRLVLELYNNGINRKRLIKSDSDRKKMYSMYPLFKYPLKISQSKRSNIYTIKLNSKDNMLKLFHYFYDGVDETMYLKRKYDIFVKGLGLKEEIKT